MKLGVRHPVLVVFTCGAWACAGSQVAPPACAGADPVAREKAVVGAVQWLGRFFEEPARVEEVGLDAAALFQEVGETATSPRIAALAMPIARRLAREMYDEYLAPDGLDSPGDRTDALWLLGEAHVLGVDAEPLHAQIRRRFAEFSSPGTINEVNVEHLDAISEEDLFGLLLNLYAFEKIPPPFDDLRPSFTLTELLEYISHKPLVSHDDKDQELFLRHAYLATHVAFVMGDWSRIALRPETLGRLFGYLRTEFPGVLAQRNIDLVAEFVDLFRSMGFDDSDSMVCAGSRFIMASQRRDGSFSDWETQPSAYDGMHATWVAAGALRDRCVLRDTPFARRVDDLAAALRDGRGAGRPSIQAPARPLDVCPAAGRLPN